MDFTFLGAIVHWENSKPGPFNTKKCCYCFFSHARYSSTHLGWRSLLAWCVLSYQSCTYQNILKGTKKKSLLNSIWKPHKNTFLPVVAYFLTYGFLKCIQPSSMTLYFPIDQYCTRCSIQPVYWVVHMERYCWKLTFANNRGGLNTVISKFGNICHSNSFLSSIHSCQANKT